jgi:putative nucleotidyltransferase with HDIG domain
MTAKILQLVNSAFFGIRRRIASPIDAASYLGLETIQSLVLSVQAFSQFDSARSGGLSVERIWSHSMMTAAMAKRIAGLEQAHKGMMDEAFTAGLLHDIGRLVLGSSLPEEYQTAVAHSGEEEGRLCEYESQELGATHAEVGAYLLGLWGLPDSIVEAVALHHRPRDAAQTAFSLLTAVHAAEAMEPKLGPHAGNANAGALDMEYLQNIGLTGRADAWREDCWSLCERGSRQ